MELNKEKLLLDVKGLNNLIDEAHQSFFKNDGYSNIRRVCVANYPTYNFGREASLTPYGRERARVCEGGYVGCFGKSTMREHNLENGASYKSPMCDHCYEMDKKPLAYCALCGLSFFKGYGCNPLPLMNNEEGNKVCVVCDDVISKIRIAIYQQTNKEG